MLRNADTHPDASWVYHQVRERLPHVGLATVHRNLTKLEEAGLIARLGTHDKASHWDGRTTPHEHVVCSGCGRIVDLGLAPLSQDLTEQAARASGFSIQGYEPQFVGLCPQCARSGQDGGQEPLIRQVDTKRRLS